MHQFINLLSGKRRATVALSLFCLTLLLAGNAFAADWYVAPSPTGNNNNNGSANSPFATIQKAHDMAVSGDVINVTAGSYREQVNITKSNLTFQAIGQVTINGTDLVGQSGGGGWTQVSGTQIWRTSAMTWDLSSQPAGYGENQLFQDTTMLHQLRWPHNTSMDVAMPTMAKASGATRNDAAQTSTLTVDASAGFNGSQAWVGAQIFINLAHKGYDGQGWVGTVTAVGPNSITCDFYRTDNNGPAGLGETVWAVDKGTEFYLFNPAQGKINDTNINDFLGNGEWYKNGTGANSTLYVKTRDGGQPNTTKARNVNAKSRYFAFAGNGTASNYKVDGFTLFGCSVTTLNNASNPTAVSTCSGVTFNNLNIKYLSHQVKTGNYQVEHSGWTGVVLNGRGHTVSNCTINYSATSAISLQGNEHQVLNNKIYSTNYMLSNAGTINTGRYYNGVGASFDLNIGYNVIGNTTHVGIYMSSFKNSDPTKPGVARIHHNTIYNYLRRSGDSGAIDMAGQDLQWARIDHNYIFNNNGQDLTEEFNRNHGIYLDFGKQVQGVTDRLIRAIVDHNVVTDCMTPLLLSGGTEVKVYNNTFIGNGRTDLSPDPTRSSALFAIGNYNDYGNDGYKNYIYNNIISSPPNLNKETFGFNLGKAEYFANYDQASIASFQSAPIFVSAKFGTTAGPRSISDFDLRENNSRVNTFIIDKGILKPEDYRDDAASGNAVVNVPDLGAFEGQSNASPDNTAPSPTGPIQVAYSTYRSFTLSWAPATDNAGGSGVGYYQLSSQPGYPLFEPKNMEATSVNFAEVQPSTTYSYKVVAYDRMGYASTPQTITFTTPAKTADVLIPRTTVATIPIDGNREANIYTLLSLPIATVASGTNPINADDLSANWTATWDANNLYVHVAVKDNIRKIDSNNWYDDDNIEIFINGNGNRPKGGFTATDFQFYIRPGENIVRNAKGNLPNGVTGIATNGSAGYNAEIKIPFSALGYSSAATALQFLGIEVNIGDDDGLATRQEGSNVVQTISRKIVWQNEAYRQPYDFGLAQLSTTPASTGDLSFENNFTNWYAYGTASINTTHVHSGAKSAYFTNGGANYTINGLTAGATYVVKAWVKAVSGNEIWITATPAGGTKVGAQMILTSWTQSGNIVVKMGASTSVTLSAWTGPTSSAYFDDFTIEPCSTCRVASAEVESDPQTEGLTLKLHPNPASREVTVDLSGFAGESAVQVKMSDMTGKPFLGKQVQIGAGVNQVTLPVGHLPQGLFFVTVQGSKTTKTAKLVITQ
jgi:hypothetical protein